MLKDKDNTKQQSMNELAEFHQRNIELEESKVAHKNIKEIPIGVELGRESILNNLLEYIMYQDVEHKVLWANKAAEQSVGLAPDELIGRYCYDIWHQRNKPCINCPANKALKTGKPQKGEINLSDGRVWLVRSYPFRDKQDNVIGVTVVTIDITEQKRAEKLLRESEKRYRTLVENINDAIFTLNLQGYITYISPVIERISLYKVDEIIGKPFSCFVHTDDLPNLLDNFKHTLAGQLKPYEFRVFDKNGIVRYIRTSSRPLLEDNQLLGLTGIITDITECKQMENALQESEEKYRVIFETTGTATAIIEEDTTISLVNTESEKLFGYSKEEVEGKKSWTEFVLKDDLDRMKEYHHMRRAGPGTAPRNYEFRLVNRQGNVRNIFATIAIIPGTKKSVTSLLDITRLKQAEAANKRRLVLEESIARISSRFVTESFNNAINAALADMGIFSRASRAYLFLLREDGVTMDNTHEWCAEEVSPQIDNLQNLPVRMFPWWMSKLYNREVIHIADVSKMPLEAKAEQEILKSQDIKSILVLPVNVKNNLTGFIGFDNIIITKEWHSNDLVLLRICSEIIGSAYTRKLTEEHIRREAAHAKALAEISRTLTEDSLDLQAVLNTVARRKINDASIVNLLSDEGKGLNPVAFHSQDLRVTFNVVLDQITTQLGIDAADILLLNPHIQILEYIAGRGFRSRAIEHSRLRPGEGYAGLAVLERRIINTTNLPEAGASFLRTPLLVGENFITYYGVPLIAKGQVRGLLEIFHRTPLDPDPKWLEFLETLAGQAAIAIDNTALLDGIQRSNIELTLAYDATIESLSYALDLRDKETEGHSKRVTEMTMLLARSMGISETDLVHVRRGALLHDIGKMGVPDHILHKPGPLTDDEWEIMRRHPVYAYEMLTPIAHLRPALDIPYCHNEKWDGTGYPRGLRGEQIPVAARIFALTDVWDALQSERPYRPGWPKDKVKEYIWKQAGKHFDLKVVKVFLEME